MPLVRIILQGQCRTDNAFPGPTGEGEPSLDVQCPRSKQLRTGPCTGNSAHGRVSASAHVCTISPSATRPHVCDDPLIDEPAISLIVPASESVRKIIRYRKSHPLGQGAFGIVWLGLTMDTGQLVAIKEPCHHQSSKTSMIVRCASPP